MARRPNVPGYSPEDYARLLATQHPELSASQIYRQMQFEGRGGRRTNVLRFVAEERGKQQRVERQLRSTPTKYLPRLGPEGLRERGRRIRKRTESDRKKMKKALREGKLPEPFQPKYLPGELAFLEQLRQGYDSFAEEPEELRMSDDEWRELLDEGA